MTARASNMEKRFISLFKFRNLNLRVMRLWGWELCSLRSHHFLCRESAKADGGNSFATVQETELGLIIGEGVLFEGEVDAVGGV